MPTFWGLGLTESCRLTRDIGYQTDRERDLPRSGALDEVKPLLPACLILIMVKLITMGQPKDCLVVISPGGKVLGFVYGLVV